MTTLLIATRNLQKVEEIQAILGDQFAYLSLKDFPKAPIVIEDADSFAGNAAKKAGQLAEWLMSDARRPGFPAPEGATFVLADDSGLEVDALSGAPGVYSARFAALDCGQPGNSTDAENNAKLLRLLKQISSSQRTARFRCVLAMVAISEQAPPSHPHVFDGVCEGRISREPRGHGGFGYDPLFVPVGCKETFAELGEDVKNRLSHRARALAKLKDWMAQTKIGHAPS